MERIGKSLYNVAPLAGAWIEMPLRNAYNLVKTVAPLAGAWIEIVRLAAHVSNGLKSRIRPVVGRI